MTEQGTGSDPTQFTTTRACATATSGSSTGTKWFVGERATAADFHIVMAVTDPDAEPHRRFSMIIVPDRHAGDRDRARLGVMNDPDARAVAPRPARGQLRGRPRARENLLGERGEAFGSRSSGSGPGRIHHCMRWIGVCRAGVRRAVRARGVASRVHGAPLADKQTVQDWVADRPPPSRPSRLLTLHAAWKIDQEGAEAARTEIAMIKYHGATRACTT